MNRTPGVWLYSWQPYLLNTLFASNCFIAYYFTRKSLVSWESVVFFLMLADELSSAV